MPVARAQPAPTAASGGSRSLCCLSDTHPRPALAHCSLSPPVDMAWVDAVHVLGRQDASGSFVQIERGWAVSLVSSTGDTLWTYDWPTGARRRSPGRCGRARL
jgi:hypothetical protein